MYILAHIIVYEGLGIELGTSINLIGKWKIKVDRDNFDCKIAKSKHFSSEKQVLQLIRKI